MFKKLFPDRSLRAALCWVLLLTTTSSLAPTVAALPIGDRVATTHRVSPEGQADDRCLIGSRTSAPAAASADDDRLRRLVRLRPEEKAKLFLPRRLGMLFFAAGERAFDPDTQVARFLRDPALRRLGELDSRWVAEATGPFVSLLEQLDSEVMIARNLDRAGLSPSPATVRRIWEEILESRRELADLPIWQGRRVFFAVGHDNLPGGPAFGKAATIAAIERQNPASLEVLQANVAGARARLAKAIAEQENLTLLFETHGRPGELRWAGSLGVHELATLFAGRRAAGRPILILGSCYGHNFGRALVERLLDRGLDPPLLLLPEEFGQATLIGRQESPFNRQLGLGGQGRIARLGDLLAGDRRESTVYALARRGLRQIR